MVRPKVSVLIITYNQKAFIRDAIEGALSQQCSYPMEIIICDDSSTDGTAGICDMYCKENPHIRYVRHEKNLGMVANWLFALQSATGDYIAICEGDDYWTDPKKLQKQVDFLERNYCYSATCHNAEVLFLNSGLRTPYFNSQKYSDYNFCLLLKLEAVFPIVTASLVFRKSAVSEEYLVGVLSPLPFVDRPLALLLSSKCPIKYIDESMSVYRKQDGGFTYAYSERDHLSNMKLVYEHLMCSPFFSERSRKYIAHANIKNTYNTCVHYYIRKQKNEFIKHFNYYIKNFSFANAIEVANLLRLIRMRILYKF